MPPQPDFSGRWTLIVALPSERDAPAALTVRQSVRRANVRGEPMTPFYDQIAIGRDSGGGTVTDTHLIGIIGGTVGGVVGPAGKQRDSPAPVNSRFAVKWDGHALVFEETTYTGDEWQPREWTERRETWTLQPNGELAIDITTRGSADRPRSLSATYRRRE